MDDGALQDGLRSFCEVVGDDECRTGNYGRSDEEMNDDRNEMNRWKRMNRAPSYKENEQRKKMKKNYYYGMEEITTRMLMWLRITKWRTRYENCDE